MRLRRSPGGSLDHDPPVGELGVDHVQVELPGGGVALIRSIASLDKLTFDDDRRYGVNIVRRALEVLRRGQADVVMRIPMGQYFGGKSVPMVGIAIGLMAMASLVHAPMPKTSRTSRSRRAT